MNKHMTDYTLYLVTDRKVLGQRDLASSIEEAIKGGVTMVQLREKTVSTMEYYHMALKVKKVTDKYGIPLIINDRVDIAMAVDANGVHLGPDDMPVDVARRIIGNGKLIGASANCVEEALKYQHQGADYLGVGALFPTKTKNDTEHVSLEQLKCIKNTVKIPVVGIGGISMENAPLVRAVGVDGIAVVSVVLGSRDIQEAARRLSAVL
ncbi:MAG: thiamine-phosphate diphosphorylase [Clostridiales bacterium GWC2_40_7]|nr:MAG: thiamine-phosphate diphosphorylase [Clostridiales bacterium GWC2_40_7]